MSGAVAVIVYNEMNNNITSCAMCDVSGVGSWLGIIGITVSLSFILTLILTYIIPFLRNDAQ